MKLRESLISRRQFLGGIIMAEAAVVFAGMSYPLIRYVFHKFKLPLPRQVAISMEELSKMPPNSARYFKYGWMPAILVRRPEGDFVVFNATCTHLDCTVTYQSDKKHFLCQCHLGIFDLDGANVSGPPPRPLVKFRHEIEGDRMIITHHDEKATIEKNKA